MLGVFALGYVERNTGLVAQLGERRVRNAEVEGSSPFRSTISARHHGEHSGAGLSQWTPLLIQGCPTFFLRHFLLHETSFMNFSYTKPPTKIDKIRAQRAIKVFDRGFGGKLFAKSFQPNGTQSEGEAQRG